MFSNFNPESKIFTHWSLSLGKMHNVWRWEALRWSSQKRIIDIHVYSYIYKLYIIIYVYIFIYICSIYIYTTYIYITLVTFVSCTWDIRSPRDFGTHNTMVSLTHFRVPREEQQSSTEQSAGSLVSRVLASFLALFIGDSYKDVALSTKRWGPPKKKQREKRGKIGWCCHVSSLKGWTSLFSRYRAAFSSTTAWWIHGAQHIERNRVKMCQDARVVYMIVSMV